MSPDSSPPSPPAVPAPVPSPELRERVLYRCGQALEMKAAARRRSRRWQCGLAAGVAVLLLVNAQAERQSDRRIARIVAEPAIVARAQPGAIRSFHARATLLAALLRDPNAL